MPSPPAAMTSWFARRSARPQGLRINRTRLMVYRYVAADRIHKQRARKRKDSFAVEPPTLRLPAVPKSMKNGKHYVVVEALFAFPLAGWGLLNWRAFIEAETGVVLYLRALTDGITGLVFHGGPDHQDEQRRPTSRPPPAATLDPLARQCGARQPELGRRAAPPRRTSPDRSSSWPTGALRHPTFQPRRLRSISPTYPGRTILPPSMPTTIATVSSAWSRTRASTLRATSTTRRFPSPSITAGWGAPSMPNAPEMRWAMASAMSNFALAAIGHVLRSASRCDWRVVLHELGGHGILCDHVDSPNFGFAHSAGDSIAAILNDPDTHIPTRPLPQLPRGCNIGRRHDRPVNGVGMGQCQRHGGYGSEQILATLSLPPLPLDRRRFGLSAAASSSPRVPPCT